MWHDYEPLYQYIEYSEEKLWFRNEVGVNDEHVYCRPLHHSPFGNGRDLKSDMRNRKSGHYLGLACANTRCVIDGCRIIFPNDFLGTHARRS